MECLVKHRFDYSLYKDDDKYSLYVVCGTSALFEVCVVLDNQRAELLMANTEKLVELVERIRLSPAEYC